MSSLPSDVDSLYREGVAALRAGDKSTARQKLQEVLKRVPRHEEAWLWLSAAVENHQERIFCLEQALTINPDSQIARQGLEKLGASPPSVAEPDELPPVSAPPPDLARPEPFQPIPEPPPFRFPMPFETPSPSPTPPPDPPSIGSAVLSELPPASPAEPPSSQAVDDESWRAPLLRAAQAQPDQASRKRQRVPAPGLEETDTVGDTGILDLFDAWAGVIAFRRRGAVRREVHIANVGHTLIGLLFSGLLMGIVTFLILQLFIIPLGGMEGLLAYTEIPAGTVALQKMSRVLNRLGILVAVISIFTYAISRAIYGVLYHAAARIVGGTGDLLQTLSAISLATVAQTIVQLVPMFWLVVAQVAALPLQVIFSIYSLIYIIWALYGAAQDLFALTTAHPNFGVLRAMATLLIAGVILAIMGCCLGLVLGALGAATDV